MLSPVYLRGAAKEMAEHINDGEDVSDVLWGGCYIGDYDDMASFIRYFLEYFQTADTDQMAGDLLQELVKMYAEDMKAGC